MMLKNVSPAIILPPPDDGLCMARLPSLDDKSKIFNQYQNELNKFYFELLKKFTWTTINIDLPFIGNALYQSCNFDPLKTLELALYYRDKTDFLSFWDKINLSIKSNNKLEADELIENFKAEILSAARYKGLKIENPNTKPIIKLLIALTPKGDIIEPLLDLLPSSVKSWDII